MGQLWGRIRAALDLERCVAGAHAALRLRQRRIELWQVVAGSLEGKLLAERPDALPNPAAEVEILLPDGTSAKAVWSWLASDATAKLVTVHFFDR